MIDALAVYKDADGELEVAHLSNVPDEQAAELGRVVGALIGLGVEGEEHLEVGETTTAEQDGWDVLDDIPRDTAAALLLIEHHWAVPLRDAIARAGGFRIGDGFISPLDLVATGLVSAQEAQDCTPSRTAPPPQPDHGGSRCSLHAESPGAPPGASPVAAARPIGSRRMAPLPPKDDEDVDGPALALAALGAVADGPRHFGGRHHPMRMNPIQRARVCTPVTWPACLPSCA